MPHGGWQGDVVFVRGITPLEKEKLSRLAREAKVRSIGSYVRRIIRMHLGTLGAVNAKTLAPPSLADVIASGRWKRGKRAAGAKKKNSPGVDAPLHPVEAVSASTAEPMPGMEQ